MALNSIIEKFGHLCFSVMDCIEKSKQMTRILKKTLSSSSKIRLCCSWDIHRAQSLLFIFDPKHFTTKTITDSVKATGVQLRAARNIHSFLMSYISYSAKRSMKHDESIVSILYSPLCSSIFNTDDQTLPHNVAVSSMLMTSASFTISSLTWLVTSKGCSPAVYLTLTTIWNPSTYFQ